MSIDLRTIRITWYGTMRVWRRFWRWWARAKCCYILTRRSRFLHRLLSSPNSTYHLKTVRKCAKLRLKISTPTYLQASTVRTRSSASFVPPKNQDPTMDGSFISARLTKTRNNAEHFYGKMRLKHWKLSFAITVRGVGSP